MAAPIEELKNRLKEALLVRKMKPIDLVEKTKISKSAISQYMSGYAKPKQDRIYLISQALNISEAWLLGYDVPMEKDGLPSEYKSYNPIMHKIPILGYISAGLPIYAEEHIDGFTYTDHNGGAEYFALRVNGDSMTAANIPDKSIVIVRRQPSVENGEIAVVRVNKENATIKRFKRNDNIVQLIPQSYNPNHQIQIYDLKVDKITIDGKVVECKVEF